MLDGPQATTACVLSKPRSPVRELWIDQWRAVVLVVYDVPVSRLLSGCEA